MAGLVCEWGQSTVVAVAIPPPRVWTPKWTKWAAPTPVVLIQVNPCLQATLTDTAAVGRRKGDFAPSHDLAHKANSAVGSVVDIAAAAAAVAASNHNELGEGPRRMEDAARCTEVYSRAHCLSNVDMALAVAVVVAAAAVVGSMDVVVVVGCIVDQGEVTVAAAAPVANAVLGTRHSVESVLVVAVGTAGVAGAVAVDVVGAGDADDVADMAAGIAGAG